MLVNQTDVMQIVRMGPGLPKAPRRRQRPRALLGATLALLGAAFAVGSCASDPSGAPFEPPANGGTTIASSTLSGQVVSVSFLPYPEGSVVARYRTTPTDGSASPSIDWTAGFEAFVTKLGWPLPEPLPQPRACARGGRNYAVLIVVDSGQEQYYGPCTRPPLVEEAAALLGTGFA